MDFIGTWYSLIPPIVMIILVLLTRKVFISLGIGIVVGALMIAGFNIKDTVITIWESFAGNFYSAEEGWSKGSLQLITFLLLLGILISFLTATGGTRAFGEWATQKIKTRNGSQYLAGLFGLIIFIDDYFSSLTVGQVSRPITDRHKVSRAKLAYLIDSTSAPVTVLSPISSWGASIIGIIAAENLVDQSAFSVFIGSIPFNFYAIAAIILVFISIRMNLNFGLMKEHESRAEETGELIDPLNSDIPGDLQNDVKEFENGRIYHLIVPILVLILTTVTSMVVTGIQAAQANGDAVTLLSIFANTNVNFSLFLGGILSVIVALIFYVLQLFKPGEQTNFFKTVWEGIKAMLPAVYILILAWMIATVIDVMETGAYLSTVVESANINIAYLPLIIFFVAGIMAFATGTSWGTFGVMIPIAIDLTANLNPDFIVPAVAASLAGSVFGDHCSPISDTTVLSSTGAGSNHIDHVLTQIPYAILAAIASVFGYLLFALTQSMFVGLLVTVGVLVLLTYVIHLKTSHN